MKRLFLLAAVVALGVYLITPAATLPGPEPGSQDFTVFVQGLNDVGPDDQIDTQLFDTAKGWDFGDRLHYRCARVEFFDPATGTLAFLVDIERVGQVPDKPSNYVKISDQGGKESEGQGGMACGANYPLPDPLVWDGTDHFPHHTHQHLRKGGVEFDMLDLHRDDCAKGYWTPGDEPGEAWLWWDADGPTHTHPGSDPLPCGGGDDEPVAVARMFFTYIAPGYGVCTHDELDGSRCSDVPAPTPTPTPTKTCNPARPRCKP